jgi:hypothetical protein
MTALEALLGVGEPAHPRAIPIEKMAVRFRYLPDDTVTDVQVVHAEDPTRGTDVRRVSTGCTDNDWLSCALSTPLGVFVLLLVHGFASRKEMQSVLHQFRNVEGQEDWATVLLQVSEDPNIERVLAEEWLAAQPHGQPPCRH